MEQSLVEAGLEAFDSAATPKKIGRDTDKLFLFKCACGNVHFRHAGYLEALMPYMRPDKAKKISKDSYQVQVCTVCRACFIWLNEQMFDVSELIDLEAWVKAERELHLATGPGGQC